MSPNPESHRRLCLPASSGAPCTLLNETQAVIPRPGRAAIGRSRRRLQGRGIYRRLVRGWTRQPAPAPRRRNSQTGSVWGVAAGHEEADSRFLGRAPGSVVRQGAGCALPRNDRTGCQVFSMQSSGVPCTLLNEPGLSFRGPATPQPADRAAGCRAEESTVGSREAGRGSPHHRRGGETAGQGQCGGAAAGNEEADSRFLGRAPGSVVSQGAGCALPRNDRLGWPGVFHAVQRHSAHLVERTRAVIPRPGHAATGRSRRRLQG